MKIKEYPGKINSLIIYILVFTYFEVVFKITAGCLWSWNLINNFLFILVISLVCKFITSLFSDKINKVLMYILIFSISLFYIVQIVMHNIFNFYFDFSLLGAFDQIMAFSKDTFKLICGNLIYIIIILLPIIVIAIFNKRIRTRHIALPKILTFVPITFAVYGLFLLSLNIKKNVDYSAYDLFYNVHNNELSLKRLGVVHTMFIDFKRYISGYNNKGDFTISDIENEIIEEDGDTPIEYDYNILDIDFDRLINESVGTIKKMHEYFKNNAGTMQNEYTGIFAGKNLILFMAESFNEIAVDKNLTPTLYKLVNSGFVFSNFYTPTISSTIGGEFQELTGLVASAGFLSPWKNGENSYPFGIANMFKNAGYNTFAYHNHTKNHAYFRF